ncbi:Gfo/Idh/MocA family protein [Clostridium sp. LP20]|uniref:Gfo/Idh/MocA family protein n=1 Tax=Clostridium sp. LP20 TaxID=3418665 RepID=UPI003EE57BA6
MRVGIIGIGDICKKAYLPIISFKEDVEIVLCTRNEITLKEIKSKYRISESVNTVAELIEKNIDCAFVHSSTESHYTICKELLSNGVNVYVDKPISYALSESLELSQIAKENNKIFKVGFNRRSAPMVKNLKALGDPNIIIIEKNRVNLPGDPRVFVFDDFIHVVDTLRFLMNNDYKDLTVNSLRDSTGLKSIVINLSNDKTTAIGIMNRDNGITEEVIEYMASGKKAIVRGLVHSTYFINNEVTSKEFGDWDNTLHKRGFDTIIDSFLMDVKEGNTNYDLLDDSLKTHKLCEEIVEKLV